ncbi:MAG: thiamine diphosphokinase [Bacteroidota bacterium]
MDEKIYKLVFKNYFDAILCLDGTLPEESFFKAFKNIPVIAADGAAVKLFKKNVFSDMIVGDLDSFKKLANREDFLKSEIIQIDEQDTNDFEKALKIIIERGFKNILLLGFHGGELEHTLNNWSVLKRFSKLVNICLFDENRYGISLFKSVEFDVVKNEIISLIPQPRVEITTENLEWPLVKETLELGMREGARNRALGEKVVLKIHSGEILLFINPRLPFAPEFL